MTYEVRLEQFEGPLDLLLHLIEKEKLDITRVSLSRVADQYLSYIESKEDISLFHLAEFLSIATRLLLLKSRALLPLLQFTEEEEEAIEDLEKRLREYKRFKEVSVEIGQLWNKKGGSFARESFAGQKSIFYPPRDLKPADLRHAFEHVLGEIFLPEKLEEETLQEIVTLEEKIITLQTMLTERMTLSFHTLAQEAKNKVDVIVSFLALLELVKQRFVDVAQHDFFGEIHINKRS